mgnify:CR=1 FL=1|tara:strand:+ start:880 stop:2142 length:1263 start_codon:yes stop_codon:yes gene_type:complete
MARRELLNAILQSFQKLGGNLNDVLGTKTNVSFLGKGKSPELMLDMDINTEALGVLPQSKAVEELTSSVGYAVAGKLNDIQANKLLSNMKAMENFYFPPAAPANITDMATRTRNLDKEGLMSLRQADDLPPGDPDLPPPGSRGEPGDVAAPFASAEETIKNLAKAEGVDAAETILPTGKGLEALKNVQNNNLIVNDLVNKIYLNAGVSEAAQPVVRANARDFLNRIKDLTDEPGNPTLSSVMEADDFKFMTEGGGGGMGDPFLLVQKYFGPKVAAAVAKLDTPNDIQLFAERLISVKDGKGRGVTDRFFDPDTVDIDDFEFADGGRVPYMAGMLVRGGKMGYQALRKYGIEGKDISRLFASLGTDKSLVGKEKTAYFQQLHKVLRNPDAFPDEIMDIQKQLGIDVGLGFKSGGLAGILEV